MIAMQKLYYITSSLQCVNTAEIMLAKCPSVSLYSEAAWVADNLRKQITKKGTTWRYKTCQISKMASPLCKMQWHIRTNIYLHLSPLRPLFSFEHQMAIDFFSKGKRNSGKSFITFSFFSSLPFHKNSFWDWDFLFLLLEVTRWLLFHAPWFISLTSKTGVVPSSLWKNSSKYLPQIFARFQTCIKQLLIFSL